MTLKDRLLEFIEFKSLTVQGFEKYVGLSNAAVSKMGDNTRRSTIDKISIKFPELNRVWLLTGQGDMLVDSGAMAVAPSPQAAEDIIGQLLATIRQQAEEIGRLKERIAHLEGK